MGALGEQCPECGEPVEPADEHCPACDAPLSDSPPPRPKPRPARGRTGATTQPLRPKKRAHREEDPEVHEPTRIMKSGAVVRPPTPVEPTYDDDEQYPEEEEEEDVLPTQLLSRRDAAELARSQPAAPKKPVKRNHDVSLIGTVEDDDDDEESTVSQANRPTNRSVDQSALQRAARGEHPPAAPKTGKKLALPELDPDEALGSHASETMQQPEHETQHHAPQPPSRERGPTKPEPRGRPRQPEPEPPPRPTAKPRASPRPAEPLVTKPVERRPEPRAQEPKPVTHPSYRPPQPASSSRAAVKPTLGIEDVDAQGALQVAQQMETSGRVEEAVPYLERAIERAPDAAPLYNKLAMLLSRDFEDHERAEQLLLQALQLARNHPLFTRNLNDIRQKIRDAKRKRR